MAKRLVGPDGGMPSCTGLPWPPPRFRPPQLRVSVTLPVLLTASRAVPHWPPPAVTVRSSEVGCAGTEVDVVVLVEVEVVDVLVDDVLVDVEDVLVDVDEVLVDVD